MSNKVLDLFPARVPIGFVVLPDGAVAEVMATEELLRALSVLQERVGGSVALSTEDLFMLGVEVPTRDAAAADELAQLRAEVIALRQDVAGVAELAKKMRDIEVFATYRDPFRVDWERPGKIGSLKANTGAFTTVTATGLVSSAVGFRRSAAAASAGYMVSQLNGSGNGNGLYWSGANVQLVVNAGVVGDWSTAGLAITGGLSATNINNTPIGQTTARNGTFNVLKANNEFGCNGATPQTKYTLGAAATDLASVLVLANNLRTMSINNGMGQT